MSHVQAFRMAAIALLRAVIFRGWITEGCTAIVGLFSFKEREERRRRNQLRRTYADLISRMLHPDGDERKRRELVKRLETVSLSELERMHDDCLRVADERVSSRRRGAMSAERRDGLWELTPLLK